MANIIGLVALAVGIAAFLFSVLALALPYWSTKDDGSIDFHMGLWDYCLGSSSCTDPIKSVGDDEAVDQFKAVRAMVVIGFICTVVALVLYVLFLFVLKDKKILGFIAGGVSIAAGLFLMIGMAIYVDKFDRDQIDLGAAFALDIVAWIAAWIAGALMFVGAMKGGQEAQ